MIKQPLLDNLRRKQSHRNEIREWKEKTTVQIDTIAAEDLRSIVLLRLRTVSSTSCVFECPIVSLTASKLPEAPLEVVPFTFSPPPFRYPSIIRRSISRPHPPSAPLPPPLKIPLLYSNCRQPKKSPETDPLPAAIPTAYSPLQ